MTLIRNHTLLVAALFILSACGEKSAGDGPYADIVERTIPKLESQAGLKFKTPPRIESRSKEEVREFVMKQLSSERAQTQLEGQQAAYKLLGLIPDTLNLRALLQRLLEEQIVGYYDPATKVLYVVEGSRKDLVEQTVAHELVHALQDQYIRIDSIQASVDNADRQLAAQAVLEGQAVYEQLRMDKNSGAMLKMPGGWDRIRDVIRDGQSGMPVFATTPKAIREGLLFPYLGGADFVRRFVSSREPSELLHDLPISTKQILNDSAYFGMERDLPIDVVLPQVTNGTLIYSNTFGEFETRLIIAQQIRDAAVVRRAASGNDGDRYAIVRTKDGDALVWTSVWDSAIDAVDFFEVSTDVMRFRHGLAKPSFKAGETTRTLRVPAKSEAGKPARLVTIHLNQIGTRSVVTIIDAPAAAGTIVDPARITLSN